MAKILIAEDEIELRDGLKTILTMAGHQILEAANGEEALALMRADRPDLVLLDMMMPVVDGTRVIEEMTADDQLHGIPIIILTNFDLGFMKEVAMSDGVRDYIIKANISLDDIPARISKHLPRTAPVTT